ncbi:Mth938-like domain-containing protein [Sphingomonas immobilis]|uniref:Mth938-like domain-containing protein n=1 Tax=Sphingomonas immobilis TaxID=3063997 RepID=A0ABT9A2L2_9SPHN|nr:Mth938-like domain-containing protein [Sphingomonas sp. CA1-15]MDO7844081.1 Mth938-like domain-containing protein [Sphingomonas sp. CA1-15]
MQFEKGQKTDGPFISGFSHGGFKVDEGVYRALLITPERADGWEPPAIADLTPEAIAPLFVLSPPPEFLLLGTGASLVRPPVSFVRAMEAKGFGIEAMDSRAAARAWAVLRGEGRWIAGALYPLT